jgi:hypothetical protein
MVLSSALSGTALVETALVRLKPDATDTLVRLKPDATDAVVRLKPDATDAVVRLKPDATDAVVRLKPDAADAVVRLKLDATDGFATLDPAAANGFESAARPVVRAAAAANTTAARRVEGMIPPAEWISILHSPGDSNIESAPRASGGLDRGEGPTVKGPSIDYRSTNLFHWLTSAC